MTATQFGVLITAICGALTIPATVWCLLEKAKGWARYVATIWSLGIWSILMQIWYAVVK
jgi:hypothetical protein